MAGSGQECPYSWPCSPERQHAGCQISHPNWVRLAPKWEFDIPAYTTAVRVGPNVGQTGHKLDKSGTFTDRFELYEPNY